MSAGADFEPLSVIVRSLSPAIVITWLALSAVTALLPSKAAESGTAIRGRRVFEPAMIAMLLIMVAAVWQQVTGAFIPFASAWPSAVAMGFAVSLVFLVVVNVQERLPFALSLFLVVVFTIPGSLFFAGVFFVLPIPVRWELQLSGIL